MAETDTLSVHGLKEMQATLKALPGRLAKRVVMGGLRAGGKVIQEEAKRNAPVLSVPTPNRKAGTVRDAIVVRKSKLDRYGVFVGIRQLTGKKIRSFKRSTGRTGAQNPDDPFYWYQLEFGNKHQRARPFMRKAFASHNRIAIVAFQRYAEKRIEREARKLARENGFK